MSGSVSVPYMSFSSASANHLREAAYQSVKKNLVQEISKTIGISFIDPADFSLKGNTLEVLEEGTGDTVGVLLTENQAKRVGKVLARAIGQVRNTSHFEYGSDHRREAVLALLPPPDTFLTSLEKFILGPLDKGLAICRDSLTACSLRAGSGLLSRSLGGAVGVIDLGAGLADLKEAQQDRLESDQINDKEGYERAEAKLVQSGLEVGAGILFITQSIWSFAAPGTTAVASAACTPLFLLLTTIGTIIGISLSVFGIQRGLTFLSRLDEYLENPEFSEEQRTAGALRYLQEMLSLSPEQEALLPQAGPEREKATLAILENKIRHVKRRTSFETLTLIANTNRAGGLEQARKLISQIKWDSYRKIALNVVAIVAISVGFAALVAGLIVTGGLFPLALALVAGLVCLGLSLYSWLAAEFFRLAKQGESPSPIA